jgi:hypothetical protein
MVAEGNKNPAKEVFSTRQSPRNHIGYTWGPDGGDRLNNLLGNRAASRAASRAARSIGSPSLGVVVGAAAVAALVDEVVAAMIDNTLADVKSWPPTFRLDDDNKDNGSLSAAAGPVLGVII